MDKLIKMLGGGGWDDCVKRTQAKYMNRPSPAIRRMSAVTRQCGGMMG